LRTQLASEFAEPPRLPRAAIAWADLTSSPAGERWNVHQRVDDILDRYPSGTVVHAATLRNKAQLAEMVKLIDQHWHRN
jgi:hypothetical protein